MLKRYIPWLSLSFHGSIPISIVFRNGSHTQKLVANRKLSCSERSCVSSPPSPVLLSLQCPRRVAGGMARLEFLLFKLITFRPKTLRTQFSLNKARGQKHGGWEDLAIPDKAEPSSAPLWKLYFNLEKPGWRGQLFFSCSYFFFIIHSSNLLPCSRAHHGCVLTTFIRFEN